MACRCDPKAYNPLPESTQVKEATVNRDSIIWLLLALILAFYAVYVFSAFHGESPWTTATGIVLAVGSLVSLWKFLVAVKSPRR